MRAFSISRGIWHWGLGCARTIGAKVLRESKFIIPVVGKIGGRSVPSCNKRQVFVELNDVRSIDVAV